MRPETPIKDLIPFPYTGNKLHLTQKPVPALKSLLATYAPQGGIVLDPFSGSGSTAMAARALDLPFIGTEKDTRYHAIAAERLGIS
jgi:adenine-specific DNA-methyltransferase